ncbi:MAG TPA: winged helix-turn-helix domain-containing protein [Bryobacteraceae bacterium]|nr:winged helix-turn-helix domain-containing protein [Bryobacteraceae bacterium]
MGTSARQKLYFGPFVLDLHSQELHRDGQRVRLPPQAFRVLELLASHAGQLVSREQIQKQVWNGDTFVDFEHGINKSIRQIRDALGDDADAPKFIETLPRRGYRFVAELTEIAKAEPVEARPAALERWGVRPWMVAAILVLATAIVLLAVNRFKGSSKPGPIRSLAVLPLANLSGDPSQDFFADGVTEELTTDIAKTAALRVISHTSVLRYKDAKKSLPEIAGELHVDAVVEGAVLRSGDRVRITAQLIRAQNDAHLWAETYERDLKDILALQDEVARDMAGEIKIKLAAIGGLARPARAVNPEAHDEYLKGRYEWNKRNPASLARALEFFQRAVEKDAADPAAYAGLADTYAILGVAGYDWLPISEAMAKAKAAALKAIEIDDTLSEAHSSLAFVTYSYDWNWHEGEKEFKRALALNPSNAVAHQWYSEYLCDLGRWPEGIAEAETAVALDPNSLIIQENLARPYYYSRQLDRAIEYSKKTLDLDPNFAVSHLRLGRAYAGKGMFAEAAAEFQRFADLVGGSTLATASLANIRARAGDRKTALRLAAELKAAAAGKPVPAYQFAIVYAGLGDVDQAIKWLEGAYRERNDFLLVMKNEPLFDNLRADARFQDIERRIGLEP